MKNLIVVPFLLLGISLFAQNPCDDLNITSVQYSPFTDSIIYVLVANSGSEIFEYPGFVLIEDGGDTLAKEMVNSFGIGSESMHILNVRPNVADPLDNFSGVLQLHTGLYSELACEWQLNQSLCASDSCIEMVLGFQNWGGALVMGDFAYTVWDSTGVTEIESGTFTMVDAVQYWEHIICVPAGRYYYGLEALTQPTGGGPTLTVSTNSLFYGPTISAYLDWFNNPITIMEVPFFIHCAAEDPTNVEQLPSASDCRLFQNGEIIHIETDQHIISASLFNVQGQLLVENRSGSTTIYIPEGLPTGIYLVVVETGKGAFQKKHFIK